MSSAAESPALDLYGMVSPNVRKVSIMLEELELPYAMHHVSVFTGEQFNPAFLTMNPVGKVPVLVDHARGATVFESGAILFYLAETHERFLPASGLARYEVMQWVMVQMASIGPMLGQYNHFSLLPAEDHPYAYARYRTQAERLYRLLDERLRDRKWLAGDDYSIADIATWPWAHYLERHGFAAADHSALLHWRNAIDARPAVGRATVRFAKEFETPSRAAIAHATPADFDRFFARKVDAPPADFSVLKRF